MSVVILKAPARKFSGWMKNWSIHFPREERRRMYDHHWCEFLVLVLNSYHKPDTRVFHMCEETYREKGVTAYLFIVQHYSNIGNLISKTLWNSFLES